MPKFRFEFHEDTRIEPVVAELADVEAAHEEAMATAAASTWDAFAEGHDPSRWLTKYYDEAGYHVGTVTYQDVLERNRERTAQGKDPSETEAGVIRSG